MSNPIDDIPIRDSMIRLGQLLKLASLVEDGVEAAELIKNGLVKVNGEIEDRRGRQLHNGDTVTVNGQTVRVSAPAALRRWRHNAAAAQRGCKAAAKRVRAAPARGGRRRPTCSAPRGSGTRTRGRSPGR